MLGVFIVLTDSMESLYNTGEIVSLAFIYSHVKVMGRNNNGIKIADKYMDKMILFDSLMH